MFYNARYDDPGIGRFVSADSIVPGAGALTVTPHDVVATKAWGERGAAANPQELNRYSYVDNNPLGAGDPTGHCSGGGHWRNFVSVFDGTCMSKGMAIAARGRTVGEKALGGLAYAGPPVAVGFATLGTAGLAGVGITALHVPTIAGAGDQLSAFEIARQGGRHSGFLASHLNNSVTSLERSIRAFDKRILEHQHKMAAPVRFAKNWNSLSEQEQAGLLRFWTKSSSNSKTKQIFYGNLLNKKREGSHDNHSD